MQGYRGRRDGELFRPRAVCDRADLGSNMRMHLTTASRKGRRPLAGCLWRSFAGEPIVLRARESDRRSSGAADVTGDDDSRGERDYQTGQAVRPEGEPCLDM